MTRLLAAAVVVSLALPVPAGAAVRFDLVCFGRTIEDGTGAERPDARRYVIDLVQKRWCRTDDCAHGSPIETLTPDLIVLHRSKAGAIMRERHEVSRVAGTYLDSIHADPAVGLQTTGQCRTAPFTGFPKAKF